MTHAIQTFVGHHGYLAVFVLMLLESMFIPIPSELIMLLGGALATTAVADQFHTKPLNWVVVAVLGIAGNVVGSWIGWAIGRYGGRALVEHRALSWLIRPHHLEKAEEFFAQRGSVAVGVGRVLPVVRTFISLPAGIAEMPIARFTVFTVIGCIPWVFALTGVGYAIGDNYDRVAKDFTPISIVIAVILVVLLVIWWRRNRTTARTTALGTIEEDA